MTVLHPLHRRRQKWETPVVGLRSGGYRLPGPDLLQSSCLLTSLTTYYIHTSSPVCIAHIHTFADLPRVRRLPATRRCLEIEQSHESTQHIEPSVRPRCPGSYLKRSAGDNGYTPSATWYVRKEDAHAIVGLESVTQTIPARGQVKDTLGNVVSIPPCSGA